MVTGLFHLAWERMDADVGCKIDAVNRFRLQRSVMMRLQGGKCMVWFFWAVRISIAVSSYALFFCAAFGGLGEVFLLRWIKDFV